MKKKVLVGIMASLFVFTASYTFAMCGTCDAGDKKGHKHNMQEKQAKQQAKMDELSSQLNLTADQETKIKDIRMKSKDDAKAVLEDAKAKIKQIRVSANEEIKALLTAEQKTKFKDLRKKSEQEPVVSAE